MCCFYMFRNLGVKMLQSQGERCNSVARVVILEPGNPILILL